MRFLHQRLSVGAFGLIVSTAVQGWRQGYSELAMNRTVPGGCQSVNNPGQTTSINLSPRARWCDYRARLHLEQLTGLESGGVPALLPLWPWFCCILFLPFWILLI